MMLVGLSILVSTSLTVRKFIRRARRRYPRFSGWLNKAKPRVPDFVRQMIEATEPGRPGWRPLRPLRRLRQPRKRGHSSS